MTPRERMEAVFRREKPDVMAWFGDLSYWHFAHEKIGDVPAAWQGPQGVLQMHRDLGMGKHVPCSCAYDQREGDEVRCQREESDGILMTTWETPVGTLVERQQWSPESYSYGYVEHAVKSVADLKIVRYIEESRLAWAVPEQAAAVDRELGDFGIPVDALPATPLSELNKHWVGVMGLTYLLADEPAEVEKTLAAMAQAQDQAYAITEQGADHLVLIAENLSGETMGGYFDRYLRDYLTERVARLHAHGKQVFIHLDGTLRGVVEKIAATGIDCLDAVTPQPCGDVSLEEMRELAGPDLLILGGLPGAIFAPPFGAADMERQVLSAIRLHKDSGTFMFGVADQIPPNADLGLVRLVGDLVEAYGRYE